MKTFLGVFFGVLAAVATIAFAVFVVFPVVTAPTVSSIKAAARLRRCTVNQISAVASLRTINTSEITYGSTFGSYIYSKDLRSLGLGCPVPAPACAGLLDELLAAGKKNGYVFQYNPGPANRRGKITTYTLTARPEIFGETGRKNFFTDETGVIRESLEDREATVADSLLTSVDY
jgi:hypothetical protein